MKRFLKKIFSFFRMVLGKEFDLLKAYSKTAVDVVNIFKDFVESPATRFIVDVTKTEADNKIREKLLQVLPQVAARLAILHDIVTIGKTNSEIYEGIINHIKEMHPELRQDFYVRFAGDLNQALSDGKLSNAEAKALTQMVFVELYDKSIK